MSPADLLLGRIYGYKPQGTELTNENDDIVDFPLRLERLDRMVRLWWERWTAVAFPMFCPRQKWAQAHRNLRENDIVLLKNDSKLGKGEYRLARVLRTIPDEEGVVRTVVIGMRKRRGGGRERAEVCKQGLEESLMAVQRLVLIQPAKEGQADPTASN